MEEIKSYLHVALVLDASGSMSSIRASTIESLRKFFDGLKSAEDKTLLDVWQFDDEVKHLVKSSDLNDGAPNTLENYTIGGCTALYDAICIGVDELGAKFAAQKPDERPDGVVFAILTDGFENASKRFTKEDVRQRIAHQTEKYKWQFQFLAANQDAVMSGADYGFAPDACVSFNSTDAGLCELTAPDALFSLRFGRERLAARKRREQRFSDR